MYKNYKSKCQKQKKSQVQQVNEEKKEIKRPEWNSSLFDEDRFKLSTAELIQRKVSMISKHQVSAKEQWLTRQEKLRKGIIDEETQRIYDTAKDSKNLNNNKYSCVRRNLSQMIHFMNSKCSEEEDEDDDNNNQHEIQQEDCKQIEIRQETDNLFTASQSSVNTKLMDSIMSNSLQQSKGSNYKEGCNGNEQEFLSEVENNLRNTREFLNQLEKCNCKEKDPNKVLKALENVQQKEQKRLNQNLKNGNNQSNSKINSQKSQLSSMRQSNCSSNCGDWNNQSKTTNKNVCSSNNNFKKQKKNNNQEDKQKKANKENIQPVEQKEDEIEIEGYFKSLNKIEDTIKFMESNIVNKSQPECSIQNQQQYQVSDNNTETNQIQTENTEQNNISIQSKKMKENNDNQIQLQKQQINNQKLILNKDEFAISPEKEDDRDYNHELNKFLDDEEKVSQAYFVNSNHQNSIVRKTSIDGSQQINDNDAISFTLTARSTENSQLFLENQCNSKQVQQRIANNSGVNLQPLSPTKFFNQPEAETKKKVRFSDDIQQNQEKESQRLQTELQRLDKQEIQQFNNSANQIEQPINSKQQDHDSAQQEGDEDNLFNLDYVKTMLEKTKKDLDKMNQASFNFPHISIGGFGIKNTITQQQPLFQEVKSFEASISENVKQLQQNFIVKTNPSLHDVQITSSIFPQKSITQDSSSNNNLEPYDDIDAQPIPRALSVVQHNCFQQTIKNFGKGRFDKEQSLNIRDHIN